MTGVAITGAGVLTPVAHTPRELHEALCAGAQAVRPVTAFAAAGLPCDLGGSVDPAVLRDALAGRSSSTIDKAGQFAIAAAQRTLEAGAFHDSAPPDLGVVLGTMFSGAHTIGEFDRRAQSAGPEYASPLDFANTVLNAAAGQVAIRLSLRGINSTIAGGHTSGLHAIGYAAGLIVNGRSTALLAGGVEQLCLESHLGYCGAGMICGTNGRPGHVPIPFHAGRSGFVLSEGAAFVLLEPVVSALRRGAHIRAEVAGFASVTDPDASECRGCGRHAIAEAIGRALDRAGIAPDRVDAVSAAANGSYAADAEEAEALAQVFGERRRRPFITAIKSVVGEALGASGPLQVIAMIEAMRDGRLPGIRGLRVAEEFPRSGSMGEGSRALDIRVALVTAVSPEGGCCALVLRARQEQP
jgi:3-oxoacyl-[acyl-carrier-protein] synthase II